MFRRVFAGGVGILVRLPTTEVDLQSMSTVGPEIYVADIAHWKFRSEGERRQALAAVRRDVWRKSPRFDFPWTSLADGEFSTQDRYVTTGEMAETPERSGPRRSRHKSPPVTVTVLMPVYNTQAYVGAAIESILGQTWRDFIFVIVDDGSTDNSAAIIEQYAAVDSRIHLVKADHQGVAHALNTGLALARGEIVVRQDADDISRAQRIELQLSFLIGHPEIAVVGSGMGLIDKDGRPCGEPALYTADPNVIEGHLARGFAPIAHPTVAFRKEIVTDLGGYRTQFDYAEDYDLWLRISERHLMSNLQEVLVDYRGHATNVTRRHRYDQRLAATIAKLAAQARRSGLPDPLDGAERLSLADLDRFELTPRERARLGLELAWSALTSFKATGDKNYLAAVEDSLLIRRTSDGQTEQVLAQLAPLLWTAREPRRSVRAILQKKRLAAARLVGQDANSSYAVANWLVHCADPIRLNGVPPASILSAASVGELVSQAVAHGVLPALMRNFSDLTIDSDLTAQRAKAQSHARLAAGHSLMLRKHADAIVEEGAGSPFTVIKGTVFARLLYPNPQLRPFTDIDLLVDPGCVPALSERLRSHGFKLAESDVYPTQWKWVHEQNDALMVKIQTNLVHAESLSATLSLAYQDLAGIEETPAAQLIVATLHGALGAHFEKLRHAVDICQAARLLADANEEERFLRLVSVTGSRLAAKTGLSLAGRFFQEPRCFEIAKALGRERYAALARGMITPAVVTSMATPARSRHRWRRRVFRELLKRTSPLSLTISKSEHPAF